jgi:hypothetical protein
MLQVQSGLVEPHEDGPYLFSVEGGATDGAGVLIGGDHGGGLDLQGAVHQDLEGVDLEVLGGEIAAEALGLLEGLLQLCGV